MAEIEESVEEQVGALGETFRSEFGEGMSQVCTSKLWIAIESVGAVVLGHLMSQIMQNAPGNLNLPIFAPLGFDGHYDTFACILPCRSCRIWRSAWGSLKRR